MSKRTDRYTDPDEPDARTLDVLDLDRLATNYLDTVRFNAWTLAVDLARNPEPDALARYLTRHRQTAVTNADRFAHELLDALGTAP